MGLTLAEGLRIPPLNQCRVVAGLRGVDQPVTAVNIMDIPDIGPFLKPGEFVLTNGYVFRDDETVQVRAVRQIAERGCAGLGVKVWRYLRTVPPPMLREAEAHGLPLVEIPAEINLSDLMLRLMGEILARQDRLSERERRKAFLVRLLHGELPTREAILTEGRRFGLLPEAEYVCLSAVMFPIEAGRPRPNAMNGLFRAIGEAATVIGANVLTVELNDAAALLQVRPQRGAVRASDLARELAAAVVARCRIHLTEEVAIGIGTVQPDVLGISVSYRQAQEAVLLGRRLSPGGRDAVHEYAVLEPHALIQHLPPDALTRFCRVSLGPLAEYDEVSGGDLLRTLAVYLNCGGRLAATARRLFVHRNTVKFRIARIQALLGVDLTDGETVFRLQLALRAHQLLEPSKTLRRSKPATPVSS